MMSIVFLGLGILAILVIIFALLLLFQGDGSRDQKLMQYFLIGSLVQNAGYLLELTAPTAEAAIVAAKMQYLGSLTVPISYCYFMFSYCMERAPEKLLKIIKIIDAVILILVFTCDYHNLYYRRVEWLKTANGHGYLNLSYGPCYMLFIVCGTIIPFVMSLIVLARVCIKRPEYAKNRRCKLIFVLSLTPFLALCSYSMKLTNVYDPTPFVLGVILSSVVILIWSRKVYDVGSLASGILIDSMSDGVIALDEQKRIISYNPAAAGIFAGLGISAIGKSVEELEDFPQDILNQDAKEEFCLNGHFYQWHTEQIIDRFGENKGYVVLVLDVTETRNYIEEIKRIRMQAEQANIAKSAFLANMSHEIRTPMNAIVGLSDIIMEESRGRKVYGYACDIKSSSRNLLALINDILDLSKVEAGKMELVMSEYHVKTLVNEVLNMMDVVASQHGLKMKSEFDMSIPCRYMGDEGRIKQILINILNNALKFTKEGYVGISVAGTKGDARDMEVLTFRISDTGCGIRKEDLDKIFENFQQVDSKRNRSVEGTGLGLSITKRLVERMNGTIDVESVYGEGTTFIIEIPQKIVDERALSEVPEETVKKEEEIKPFVVKGYKALVVDDNLINRKIARIFLESYGMETDEAECGADAIEFVRGTRYDMIFMDHMMPEMDGIETTRIIRTECGENGSSPIIIALTANAMEGVRECFLENGFQDFITKPLDRRPLHEALLKWIPEEKRTPSSTWVGENRTDGERHREFQEIFIEGVDMDEVVRHYLGSVEEYKELLDLYCLDGKRKLVLLKELWEKRDYKTYGIEVHGLKSASANVGAMKISHSAREHESAVNRGDTTYVDSHVSQLLADYEEQLGHIRNYLAKSRKLNYADKKDVIEKEALLEKIRDALEALENFRAKECAEKIKNLLGYRLQDDMEACLEEIQEQLRLYEDDAAEQLLRELIEQITKEE